MTIATVAPGNMLQATTNPNDNPSNFSYAYQQLTNYGPGSVVDLSDADYANCLANGAILNPATVTIECGTSGAYQKCRWVHQHDDRDRSERRRLCRHHLADRITSLRRTII